MTDPRARSSPLNDAIGRLKRADGDAASRLFGSF
jgi:hypothetical protein